MTKEVKRGDIENKLREIQDEVASVADTAKPAGVGLAVSLVTGAIGIAYIVGQRRSRRRSTVVEIRRV